MRSEWKLALVLAAATPLVQAADETGMGYVTMPQIGWVWADSSRNVEDDRYYGLRIGQHVGSRWSLELNATNATFDATGGGELDLTTLSVDGLRVFRRSSRVSPYFSFGAGYIQDNPTPGPRRDDWLGQLGAGLLIDAAQNDRGSFLFQLRPEIKARWDGNSVGAESGAVDYLAGLGFVFAFGPEPTPQRTRPAPQPAPDPPPPAEPPAPVPPPPPVEQEPLVLRGVHFSTNSAQLTPQARPVLDDIAMQLREYPSVTLEVHGHTDSLGDENYNHELSHRRAETVANYLIRRGVSGERVSARGFGETRPIADNGTAAGRAENRRVALMVLENPNGVEIVVRDR